MSRASHKNDLTFARARSRGLLIWVFIFSFFTSLLMLTGPLFMLQIYDRVLGSRSEETLVALVILVAMLYFFYWLLEFARGRVMARVGARFHVALGKRVFMAALERAALKGRQGAGGSALQDLDALRTVFGSPVLLAVFDLPWTPVFFTAIFIFHPLLGWLGVAGGALLIVVTLVNRVMTRRSLEDARIAARRAQRLATQAEETSEVVWSQGMGPVITERWASMQDEAGVTALRANDRSGTFSSFSKSFRLFLQSAMLGLGAYLVLQNEMTAGAIIASSILLGRAMGPIEQLLGQWETLQRARAGWRSLRELLDDIPVQRTPSELPRPEARLTLTNIGLRGPNSTIPILQGITFELQPGEALGILGRSGAGKTTLMRIIQGLVTPSTGDVRLGGATLDQYGPERLGRYLGCLPQDIRFFEGTVAENIAHMELEPDIERVVAAAQVARVHDIILQLPKGYDTLISDNSHLLSGGQRQRLAMARAVYHDPVVLLLDEPNSALDAEGSEALNQVVQEMKSLGKSVLIMTHRPKAIASCDRLLILDGGRPKSIGPRDQVIAAMMQNAPGVQRAVKSAARGATTKGPEE